MFDRWYEKTIPDLVNVYMFDKAYLWLRLDARMDLDPIEAHGSEQGACPDWLQHDYQETLWASMGHEYGHDLPWLNWGLEHGVAPSQPFLYRVDAPECSQDYWGEWDAEYNGDLIRVLHWSNQEAADSWDLWLREGEAVLASKLKSPELIEQMRRLGRDQ